MKTLLVWCSILFSSAALAQPTEQKKLAAVAQEETRKLPALERAQADASVKEQARQKQLNFDRLCTFRPVMSDAAIEGCRQAHRL